LFSSIEKKSSVTRDQRIDIQQRHKADGSRDYHCDAGSNKPFAHAMSPVKKQRAFFDLVQSHVSEDE
jgi:hypothetical protein